MDKQIPETPWRSIKGYEVWTMFSLKDKKDSPIASGYKLEALKLLRKHNKVNIEKHGWKGDG